MKLEQLKHDWKEIVVETKASLFTADEQVSNVIVPEPDVVFWMVLLLTGVVALLIGCFLASYSV